MAYTTVNKSTDYFNTKLYTGTGSSNALTGVGFQPDLTWIKQRNETRNHAWFDAVRGVTKLISSSSNGAQSTQSNGLTAFGADGFTVVSHDDVNKSSGTYASWNWKANGAGSANTDGSTNSTVSVNTTAGFSVVKYTGSGANATIGHGLGVAPDMIIVKNLTEAGYDWMVYHQSIGSGKYIRLNNTNGDASGSTWNNTDPTSSVFSVVSNSSDVNKNGNSFIAYCFASKTGYSKFGKYVGNGNSSGHGAFVYTGFKPAFFMVKNVSAGGHSWYMFDNKRDVDNPTNKYLVANTTAADASFDWMDFNSNGIKVRGNSGGANNSGESYIYMAFGQSLVGSNNIPCTAR